MLTTDKTTSSIKLFAKYGVVVDKVINDFTKKYYEYKDLDFKDWSEIYKALDVKCLKDYDLIYIAGGLIHHSTKLNFYNSGKFPYNKHIKFQSTGIKIINILALLKAHKLYNIPIHELAFDPEELHLSNFHKDYAPIIGENYYLYHGYSYPEFKIKRLDSLQESFIKNDEIFEKTELFTFGYTYSDDFRLKYIQEFENFVKSIPNPNIYMLNL